MTDKAVIRAYDDGPLLVRGAFEIQTQDGDVIDARRATVALCRCGRSAIKPFCDGSHVAAGFRASTSARRANRTAG
ncbi:CDGSH iron-sulfur domain-containing protein [Jiangella asiatica]|uniref:CDGSH iron-sulfur domain-containing protein n=1 Tax=Jiangella asiatica TaxID=2530372 RepID=A0A4R5DCW8_9ACTN|nr:CDGSH iron-sulfur domain-containing protein [Jiangella asiatica]TDE08113.1 CDGSH iron-sulfur domain-containing protein [Jiangella asiatica]